jgi:hypothetical protein
MIDSSIVKGFHILPEITGDNKLALIARTVETGLQERSYHMQLDLSSF